ncbi:hypothetical protein [Primorskyibacter sp. S87]|uniref:hypothetical protein n=1 Tax=Primorskyibacter sp. S87 TaxID=3415126 RepID=UPI003C7B0BF5
MTDDEWTVFQKPDERAKLDDLRAKRDAARDEYNEEYKRQMNRCTARKRRSKDD